MGALLEEARRAQCRPDKKAALQAKKHWDSIAKPLDSLGRLETSIIQIAGIRGSSRIELKKRALLVFCADNGVVEEGISQTGQEVTAVVAENMLDGKATSAILCRQAGADIYPVDVGMCRDTRVPQKKMRYGTGNIAREPAMTRSEAEAAVETGILLVKELKEKGYDLIATGEMGIGNTTTTSAVVCALLDRKPEEAAGRGAGLSDEGLNKKIAVIRHALELHQPRKEDGLDVLCKVGGLDIAAMTGAFLGGMLCGIPVVLDGVISQTAALLAAGINESCRAYMIPSHASKEPAGRYVMEALGFEAVLHGEMCLGEGCGAVMLLPLLDMALGVYKEMSSFDEIQVKAYKRFP